MSLSKTAKQPAGRMKCSRCRHHGIIVPQKGHASHCPFLKCGCSKCSLITKRTELTALLRNLERAQNKRENKKQPTSSLNRAAEGTSSSWAPDPDGGARHSATSAHSGAWERAATRAWYPTDPRSRPAEGRESSAALNSGTVLLLASCEKESCPPSDAPYSIESGQTAPLPVIRFPFRVPGQCPGSYAPCPNFPLNMSVFPAVAAGLYNNGVCGPLMFPHFQSGALHYPPPAQPGPPADCRQVFFTRQPPPLPEPFQEEPTSKLHPQPPPSNL